MFLRTRPTTVLVLLGALLLGGVPATAYAATTSSQQVSKPASHPAGKSTKKVATSRADSAGQVTKTGKKSSKPKKSKKKKKKKSGSLGALGWILIVLIVIVVLIVAGLFRRRRQS
ncbi:hypothetical protein ACIBL6_37550 [Streptomyces sp. NPDC050400]|uniref:hypothetical protein n=1 Tax=Streptomyces sp. NPDC050400 TaxID=3365610 RepID=UPI0037906682